MKNIFNYILQNNKSQGQNFSFVQHEYNYIQISISYIQKTIKRLILYKTLDLF